MTGQRHSGSDTSSLRVLLAHEDRLELYGLARALADDGIEVAGEAHRHEQVIPLVARTRPDVLLISAALVELDGFDVLAAVQDRYAATQVIVLAGALDTQRARTACAAGAAGFVSTDVDPCHVGALLQEAAAGHFYFLPPEPAEHASAAPLTERERAVLGGAARGLSNDAIGRELWLSPHTVKSHLHRIYAKLDVANRTEAARWAHENGLVEHAPSAA